MPYTTFLRTRIKDPRFGQKLRFLALPKSILSRPFEFVRHPMTTYILIGYATVSDAEPFDLHKEPIANVA
jgi:hypothetical protein